MGRNKHQRADKFLEELKHAEKYAAIFESEKKQRDAYESMTRKEQIAAYNAENRRRRRVDRSVADTTTCQLPKCERPTITLAGDSLGICYIHAADIAVYWDIQMEDFRVKLARVDRIEKQAARDRLETARFEQRLNSPGYIYYLLVGDRIKIGFTLDVRQRLRAYPPGTPLLAMHPGTKQLEKELHQQFAGARAAGREWFIDAPEIREHIKTVIEQFGEPDRARYEWRDQHRRRNLKAG